MYGGFFMQSGVNHFRNVDMLAGYASSKKVPMPKQAVLGSGLLMSLVGLWIVTGIYV